MTGKLCRKAHALRNRMKTITTYEVINIASNGDNMETFKIYDIKGHLAFVSINIRNYRIMDIQNVDMPFYEVRKIRETIKDILK